MDKFQLLFNITTHQTLTSQVSIYIMIPRYIEDVPTTVEDIDSCILLTLDLGQVSHFLEGVADRHEELATLLRL